MDDLLEFANGDTNYVGKLNTNNSAIVDAVTAVEVGKQSLSEKGQPNGYAPLDADGHVPGVNLGVDFLTVRTALADANLPISVNGQIIEGVGTPVNPTDGVNKAYVDASAQGLSIKDSCVALSDANIASLSGLAHTVDGVAIDTDGYRVLLIAQTTGSQNGIWVAHSGAWTRASDLDAGDHAQGAFTFVEAGGTDYGGQGWACRSTAPSDVVGTDSLTFTQFSGGGNFIAGTGIDIVGNTISTDAAVEMVANKDAPDGYAGLDGDGLLDPAVIPPQPYDFVTFYPGVPTDASQLIARIAIVRSVTLPEDLTDSVADAAVAATGTTTFTIERNGTGIGSVQWSAAGTIGVFTFAAPVTLDPGDILTITGPATADATLADISITLAGTR